MTKEQAIIKMKKGYKITHIYFQNNEWITIENEMVVTEDGYKVSQQEFWKYRSHSNFNKGYSIFNNNTITTWQI